VSDVNDDFSKLPKSSGTSMIYMIGCIVRDNRVGETYYLNYVVDKLTYECEGKMVHQWLGDVIRIAQQDPICMVHWSNAEYTLLDRVLKKWGAHPLEDKRLTLIDLFELVRGAQVAIPGAFSYGLKDVAKALHALGKIESTWKETAGKEDMAMTSAWTTEALALAQGKSMGEMPQMEPVIEYNRMDCQVLLEILELTQR
jgi:hypothetical protein